MLIDLLCVFVEQGTFLPHPGGTLPSTVPSKTPSASISLYNLSLILHIPNTEEGFIKKKKVHFNMKKKKLFLITNLLEVQNLTNVSM